MSAHSALKRKHDPSTSSTDPVPVPHLPPTATHPEAGPSSLPPTSPSTRLASPSSGSHSAPDGTLLPSNGHVPSHASNHRHVVDLTEPRRYLVIDGGGTKTTVLLAIVDPDLNEPVFYRGEAGPSNLTSGLDACVAAVTTATLSCLTQAASAASAADLAFPLPPGVEDTPSPPFDNIHTVWAGIAGCARPPDHALLRPSLENLFPTAALSGNMRLTNDAELLTAPLGEWALKNTKIKRCVTLVCGTGSLALAWSLVRGRKGRASTAATAALDAAGADASAPSSSGGGGGTSFRQDARSGGWGPVLGDEGSGFALGKAAIRDLLTRHANKQPLSEWHHEILRSFGTKDPGALIPQVAKLETAFPHAEADTRRKARIARCTRPVVLAAVRGEASALGVLRKVSKEIIELLRPLVEEHIPRDKLGETVLVVGGGLGVQNVFWELVQQGMAAEGWEWAGVDRVGDTAKRAMEYLMRPPEPEERVKLEKGVKAEKGTNGSNVISQGVNATREPGQGAADVSVPTEKKKRGPKPKAKGDQGVTVAASLAGAGAG